MNRLVPNGEARVTAERLAAEIAGHPQACMRNDRLSVLEQQGLSEDDAIASEYRRGFATIEETGLSGVERFRAGAGRHGSFNG